MRWSWILLFLILQMVAAASLGSTITVNTGDDVATKIGSANAGDTVVFGAGSFEIRKPITIPSGVTLMGTSPDVSRIAFKISGGENSYGFVIPANARDVTIEELDLVSNHGVVAMELGSSYSNIVISHNNIRYGNGELPDGTLVYGISVTIPNDGLQIVHNFFHDSPNSCRNWCIFFASDTNLDYNEFNNINDGGQLVDPGPRVSFSFNYGIYIHRMGQEVRLYEKSKSFICTGNVFYDYVSPYYDTEGVSIVGPSGAVDITDNYFDASFAPGSDFGEADDGGNQRFGYAIECTGAPCKISGNTIVGTWAECVSSDTKKAEVTDNSVYGQGLWGDFEGEPGPHGYGSISASRNLIDRNIGDASGPPANTHAGPKNHSN